MAPTLSAEAWAQIRYDYEHTERPIAELKAVTIGAMQHCFAPAFPKAGDRLKVVAQPEGEDCFARCDLFAARQRDDTEAAGISRPLLFVPTTA